MGLAASQIRLLTLTARKADLELDLTTYSSRKMAVAREMQQLSSDYYSMLQNKQVAYYANNRYNKMNYNYLMGSCDWTQITSDEKTIKNNNSMILTDYKGNVVLSSFYANIFANVMGLDSKTSGGVCNPTTAQYAKMLYTITNCRCSESDFETAINQKLINSTVERTDGGTEDNSEDETTEIQKLVNFYLPILKAAAANGWTTEYEQYYTQNNNYISDALVSGSFQLALVDVQGNYTTDDSLTFFVNAGYITTNSDSDRREEITAWYQSEKLVLTNKETYWDTEISNTSTELEATKTEIDSVQKLIDDATKKFQWNT